MINQLCEICNKYKAKKFMKVFKNQKQEIIQVCEFDYSQLNSEIHLTNQPAQNTNSNYFEDYLLSIKEDFQQLSSKIDGNEQELDEDETTESDILKIKNFLDLEIEKIKKNVSLYGINLIIDNSIIEQFSKIEKSTQNELSVMLIQEIEKNLIVKILLGKICKNDAVYVTLKNSEIILTSDNNLI